MRWHLARLCLLVIVLTSKYARSERYRTVYQEMQRNSEYSSFSDLVRSNARARMNLQYELLTVFAPENKAFDQYPGDTYADLAFYHMSFEVKTLERLRSTDLLHTVKLTNPPLWITRVNDDIYVNNAKILRNKSKLVSKDNNQPQQVLHTIDRVLDPAIASPDFSPSAYDFLTSSTKWNLGTSKAILKYLQKVQENRLLTMFKEKEPRTFFIPIDSGLDPFKYKMVDRKVVLRHAVPKFVLFTRPADKNLVTVTDDATPFTVSIDKVGDKWFVTRVEGDFEEFTSEIVLSDIPVTNGVVHLIAQPLGNFIPKLKPFPYLPILEKVTNDPEIDVFFQMGNVTRFNEKFNLENVSFTYFVPKDSAFIKTSKAGLEPTENSYDILARHLVISNSPYSMQQLATMTRLNNNTAIELNTEGGPLRIAVFKTGPDGNYYIKWNHKHIEVVRPDYECTNGVVHILNGPMVNFRMRDDSLDAQRSQGDSLLSGYWKIVKDIIA